MTRQGAVPVAAMLALLSAHVPALAADIQVYSTIGLRSLVEELKPKFEQASGHRLDITWGLAGALTKQVQDGDTPDALLAIRGGIDGLVKAGKVVEASASTLSLSGVGVSVRAGAAKPDISTADALKAALLAAKGVAYSDPAKGGASGVHFAKVTERLGIADAVKAKARHPETAGLPGKLLLTGEAELAVSQVPELLEVPGTELVGPLPGDLQNITTFAGGVLSAAKEPAAAAAWLAFLQTPEAAAAIKAKGMELPASRAKGS